MNQDVATVEADMAAAPAGLLWQGFVRFAQAPAPGTFRLVVEEREYLAADHIATGAIGGTLPGATAGAPGRVIYAEIVLLDDVLTVAPPPQGGGLLPDESWRAL